MAPTLTTPNSIVASQATYAASPTAAVTPGPIRPLSHVSNSPTPKPRICSPSTGHANVNTAPCSGERTHRRTREPNERTGAGAAFTPRW